MRGVPPRIDIAIMQGIALRPESPEWAKRVAQGVTLLGEAELRPLAIVAGIAWLAWRRNWQAASVFVGGCLCSITLVSALKHAVLRVRPHIVPWLDGPVNPSFPSGHSANTLAIVLLLALLSGRRGGVVVALAIGLAVGISRVLLGVHWPSDVLGGWLLGAGVALLAYGLWRNVDQRRRHVISDEAT